MSTENNSCWCSRETNLDSDGEDLCRSLIISDDEDIRNWSADNDIGDGSRGNKTGSIDCVCILETLFHVDFSCWSSLDNTALSPSNIEDWYVSLLFASRSTLINLVEIGDVISIDYLQTKYFLINFR
jgi:hypothetical protein